MNNYPDFRSRESEFSITPEESLASGFHLLNRKSEHIPRSLLRGLSSELQKISPLPYMEDPASWCGELQFELVIIIAYPPGLHPG